MTIHQDVNLYAGHVEPGARVPLALAPKRRAWVQVLRGEASVNGQALSAGDGASVEGETEMTIAGGAHAADVLVFDMA